MSRPDYDVYFRGNHQRRLAMLLAVIVRKKPGARAVVKTCMVNWIAETHVLIWGVTYDEYVRLMGHLGRNVIDLRDYGMGALDE